MLLELASTNGLIETYATHKITGWEQLRIKAVQADNNSLKIPSAAFEGLEKLAAYIRDNPCPARQFDIEQLHGELAYSKTVSEEESRHRMVVWGIDLLKNDHGFGHPMPRWDYLDPALDRAYAAGRMLDLFNDYASHQHNTTDQSLGQDARNDAVIRAHDAKLTAITFVNEFRHHYWRVPSAEAIVDSLRTTFGSTLDEKTVEEMSFPPATLSETLLTAMRPGKITARPRGLGPLG